MVKHFSLMIVQHMPKTMEEGVLYYSKEYKTAAHLCACGCGEKIRTPITPTEWSISNSPAGPSLYPSIGNWQKKCRSHYWIASGRIKWADQWSTEQIEAGRRGEESRRRNYYASQTKQDKISFPELFKSLWEIIKNLFK